MDGDPTNNRLVNLRWGRPVDNMADRERHGTTARGKRNGKTKITETQAREIKRLLRTMPQDQIMTVCGVPRHIVADISARRTWRHLIAS